MSFEAHHREAYIAVVNPDLGGILDLDKILALWGIMEVKVLKNDVRCLLDSETATCQARLGPRANDGSIAGQVNDWGNLELAIGLGEAIQDNGAYCHSHSRRLRW